HHADSQRGESGGDASQAGQDIFHAAKKIRETLRPGPRCGFGCGLLTVAAVVVLRRPAGASFKRHLWVPPPVDPIHVTRTSLDVTVTARCRDGSAVLCSTFSVVSAEPGNKRAARLSGIDRANLYC